MRKSVEEPRFQYPAPRYADDDMAYIATAASVLLCSWAESPWAQGFWGAAALYCLWQWHRMKRDNTIDRLLFRRARIAENFDQNGDESRNSNVMAMLDRCSEKIKIMQSQRWRVSEPVTMDERHEREKQRAREKQLQRRAKQLKVGSRVVIRTDGKITDAGTVTSVDRKFDAFTVKWDEGEEIALYFTDLEWIEIAP